MRTIKFRGLNQFGRWFYGSLYVNEKEEAFIDMKDWQREPVKKETVGQFTGLLDKAGKEIYEGDIVNHHNKNGREVVCYVNWWKEAWVLEYNSPSQYLLIHDMEDSEKAEIEVIGNIYENKKEKK